MRKKKLEPTKRIFRKIDICLIEKFSSLNLIKFYLQYFIKFYLQFSKFDYCIISKNK